MSFGISTSISKGLKPRVESTLRKNKGVPPPQGKRGKAREKRQEAKATGRGLGLGVGRIGLVTWHSPLITTPCISIIFQEVQVLVQHTVTLSLARKLFPSHCFTKRGEGGQLRGTDRAHP